MYRGSLVLKALFSNSVRNNKLIVSQQQLKRQFKNGDKPEFAYATRHIVFPQGYKPYKINLTTDVFMWGFFGLFYFMCFSYIQKYNAIHDLEGIPHSLK